MYDELFNAWKYEFEHEDLGSLKTDFYSKLSEYISSLKELNAKKTKNSLDSYLLVQELNHVVCMVEGLLSARYKKIINFIEKGDSMALEILPLEEKNIFSIFFSFIKKHQAFKKKILQSGVAKKEVKKSKNRVILRFLKDVPKLIGVDLKSYGPFLAEDVASLPYENAELLIKQGLGKLVETE